MPAPDLGHGIRPAAHGDLDDGPNARSPRRVDRMAFALGQSLRGGRDEKNALHTLKRPVQHLRLVEIGGDDRNVGPREVTRPIGTVHERANWQALRDELPNHLAPDRPGRARHENHGAA